MMIWSKFQIAGRRKEGVMNIREGQIWKEDDSRFDRFIRVTYVRRDEITFRTCDPATGVFTPGSRFSCAKVERFGKARGYKLFRDQPAAPPESKQVTR